jgi:hypothetical protein
MLFPTSFLEVALALAITLSSILNRTPKDVGHRSHCLQNIIVSIFSFDTTQQPDFITNHLPSNLEYLHKAGSPFF